MAGGYAIKTKTRFGFLDIYLSNLLWVLWGWHDGAYALIAMQFGLLLLNIRGAFNNPV